MKHDIDIRIKTLTELEKYLGYNSVIVPLDNQMITRAIIVSHEAFHPCFFRHFKKRIQWNKVLTKCPQIAPLDMIYKYSSIVNWAEMSESYNFPKNTLNEFMDKIDISIFLANNRLCKKEQYTMVLRRWIDTSNYELFLSEGLENHVNNEYIDNIIAMIPNKNLARNILRILNRFNLDNRQRSDIKDVIRQNINILEKTPLLMLELNMMIQTQGMKYDKIIVTKKNYLTYSNVNAVLGKCNIPINNIGNLKITVKMIIDAEKLLKDIDYKDTSIHKRITFRTNYNMMIDDIERCITNANLSYKEKMLVEKRLYDLINNAYENYKLLIKYTTNDLIK